MSYTAIITGEGHWPAMPTPAAKGYVYKDGYISLDGMCIGQIVGHAQHIKDMIAKANAADAKEPKADADGWIPWGER